MCVLFPVMFSRATSNPIERKDFPVNEHKLEQQKMRKYEDSDGNVYGAERSFKTGTWVVIRTNPGGNRKGAKNFAVGKPAVVQKLLDDVAMKNDWKEVP